MSLTPSDSKFLINALRCLDESIKVNFTQLAEVTGVSSAKVAANGFRNAMKKVTEGTATTLLPGKSTSDADGGTTKPATKSPKTPKTPKAAASKGKAKEESAEDSATPNKDEPVTTPTHNNSEDDVEATPMTPATPSSGKKRPATTTETDEDAATGSPTKKRTRKPPTPKTDDDGNPVPRAKSGRKPKLDDDGNPVPRAKPGRKPKLDEAGNPLVTARVRKPTKAQLEKQLAADKAAEDEHEHEVEEKKTRETGVLNSVDVLFQQGRAQATNSFTPINAFTAVNEAVKAEEAGDEEGEEGEVKDEYDASGAMGSQPADDAGQEV